jgi:hypothetical protein
MAEKYGFRASNSLSEIANANECLDNLGIDRADFLPFENSAASGVEARDYEAIIGLKSSLEQQIVTLTGFASSQLASISTRASRFGATFSGSILADNINNDRPYVTPSGLAVGPSTSSYFSPSASGDFANGAEYKLGPVSANTTTTSGLNYTGVIEGWNNYYSRYKNFVTIGEEPSWTTRRIPLFLPPPTTLSGCVVWLDAEFSEFDLVSSNRVSQWKGVNRGPVAAQATDAQRPLLVSNVLNGKPAVRFDGSNDSLTFGDLSYLTPTAATVVIVARISASNYNLFGTLNNTTIRWNNGIGVGALGVFTTTVQTGFPSIGRFNGTYVFAIRVSQAFGLEFRVNGLRTDYKSSGFTFAPGNTWNLGRSGGATAYFNGDIHSFAVFNRVLSDKELRTVEEYLGWRYDAIYDPDRTQQLQLEDFATIDLESGTPIILG